MTHKGNTSIIIQMKVFDDHITLWNGGTLPPGYTVEMLMEPHESHPRNRLMANVFYLAGFIEAWGRGYEKIPAPSHGVVGSVVGSDGGDAEIGRAHV